MSICTHCNISKCFPREIKVRRGNGTASAAVIAFLVFSLGNEPCQMENMWKWIHFSAVADMFSNKLNIPTDLTSMWIFTLPNRWVGTLRGMGWFWPWGIIWLVIKFILNLQPLSFTHSKLKFGWAIKLFKGQFCHSPRTTTGRRWKPQTTTKSIHRVFPHEDYHNILNIVTDKLLPLPS